MKRFRTGLVLFGKIDIICLSFSLGSSLSYLVRKWRKRQEIKAVDPLVTELKSISPVIAVSVDGKPLKLPLVRGGDENIIKGWSQVIKSKRLAALIKVIINAKQKHQLISFFFSFLNESAFSNAGFCFAVVGSLDYTQFILVIFPATLGGFVIEQVIGNPLVSVFLPLLIVYGRRVSCTSTWYGTCSLRRRKTFFIAALQVKEVSWKWGISKTRPGFLYIYKKIPWM